MQELSVLARRLQPGQQSYVIFLVVFVRTTSRYAGSWINWTLVHNWFGVGEHGWLTCFHIGLVYTSRDFIGIWMVLVWTQMCRLQLKWRPFSVKWKNNIKFYNIFIQYEFLWRPPASLMHLQNILLKYCNILDFCNFDVNNKVWTLNYFFY